jgi:hypothetical protein
MSSLIVANDFGSSPDYGFSALGLNQPRTAGLVADKSHPIKISTANGLFKRNGNRNDVQ